MIYDVKAVSKMLKLSERNIRRHAERMKQKKIGNAYIFNEEDIKAIISRMGKGGRPKGVKNAVSK